MHLLDFRNDRLDHGSVSNTHLLTKTIQPAQQSPGFHFGMFEILRTAAGILARLLERDIDKLDGLLHFTQPGAGSGKVGLLISSFGLFQGILGVVQSPSSALLQMRLRFQSRKVLFR